MHLRGASPLSEGEKVRTGQRIGQVGESGNASGCHLHFELWSAPGWYTGGEVVDPVPRMRAWDRWS
jgi:murein DD-endopeptidase MepM/ murein hydrolase activator NlpD